jgi:hypothetical protein
MKKTMILLIFPGMVIGSSSQAATPPNVPQWVDIKVADKPESPVIASPAEITNNQAEEAALEDALIQRWAVQGDQATINKAVMSTLYGISNQ